MNRYREVLNQPDWRNKVKFSPHSHLMAKGYLEDADEFFKRTGWIYRNLGPITNSGGLTRYLLSHAPDITGIHSYRQCGDLKKHVVEGEIKIPVFPKCPECIEEGKQSEDAGMVLAKLKTVEYRRDENRHNQLISWEFKEDGLSQKPYRITQVIQVYRRKTDQRRIGAREEDPPPIIAEWLSEEQKERQLREWKLLKKERERIRKAQQWIPWSDWIILAPDVRSQYKWRKYFSQEEYAAASADWQVKMFEWS